MKVQKYLSLAFVATVFLPLLNAKTTVNVNKDELNLGYVHYIELEEEIDLGFDTKDYLPDNFDPYSDESSIMSLNYLEEEDVELGFDTKEYLPEGFDAYKK